MDAVPISGRTRTAVRAKLGEPVPYSFVAGALLLGLLGSCGDPELAAKKRPKRIVVITVDTLRLDGFTAEAMPESHALLSEGLVFSNFYSATSTTQPTHATMLTGLHPWEHGVTRNGLVLDEEHTTLAEELRAMGYWTSAVINSFPLERAFGYARGFDAFDDELDDGFARKWAGKEVEGARFYSLAESAVNRAEAAIDAAPDGPQFFWVHLFDPHDPYGDTPSAADGGPVTIHELRVTGRKQKPEFADLLARARSQYDADVADMDQHVARLIRAALATEDHDTTVIFTSDHGESFGEDLSIGHGYRLTSPQVHVPLAILRSRQRADASARREDVAGTLDIAATVATMAGIDDFALDGRNLLEAGAESAPAGVAFGMRRLLVEDTAEVRLDRSRHVQSEPLFFAVHRGVLVAGNRTSTWRADAPESTEAIPDQRELQALFATFQSKLSSTGAAELNSDAAKEALGALGYGR